MSLEIITPKGTLKYRMPNVLEVYDLLDVSGVATGEKSQIKLKRNILASIGHLIDFSGIEGVTSYDDLLNDIDDMIIPLGEIADLIIVKAFNVFKKKTTLPTESAQ